MSDIVKVPVGGEIEDVYRVGDEIVISGCTRLYVDEAEGLARALLKVAKG